MPAADYIAREARTKVKQGRKSAGRGLQIRVFKYVSARISMTMAIVPSTVCGTEVSQVVEVNLRARQDSNLRRSAGVSEAGACCRNPEPAKRERDLSQKALEV